MKELKDLIRNRVIDFNDSSPKEMKEFHTKAIIAALAGEVGNRYCNDNVTPSGGSSFSWVSMVCI